MTTCRDGFSPKTCTRSERSSATTSCASFSYSASSRMNPRMVPTSDACAFRRTRLTSRAVLSRQSEVQIHLGDRGLSFRSRHGAGLDVHDVAGAGRETAADGVHEA